VLATVVGYIAVVYPVLIVLGMAYKRLTAPGFDVAGKHVVVTGGSQGLGMSVAARYAKAGANVTLLARTKSKLEAAQAKIQAEIKTVAGAGNVHWVSCDVGDEAKVKAAMAESVKEHGKDVDILVCSAGSARPGYFSEMDRNTQVPDGHQLLWDSQCNPRRHSIHDQARRGPHCLDQLCSVLCADDWLFCVLPVKVCAPRLGRLLA